MRYRLEARREPAHDSALPHGWINNMSSQPPPRSRSVPKNIGTLYLTSFDYLTKEQKQTRFPPNQPRTRRRTPTQHSSTKSALNAHNAIEANNRLPQRTPPPQVSGSDPHHRGQQSQRPQKRRPDTHAGHQMGPCPRRSCFPHHRREPSSRRIQKDCNRPCSDENHP